MSRYWRQADTTYLVNAHVNHASALSATASTLKATLTSTAADVGQLFQKIDRKASVEAHNATVSSHLQVRRASAVPVVSVLLES